MWPCHQIVNGSWIGSHHWEGNKLVPGNSPIFCFSALTEDTYTFIADLCADEKVELVCVDCLSSPCQ
mgnify:CR=1 FL=1